MAYADCIAAALARLKKADLYTGDSTFKAMETNVKVVWL
jgi:predicted nucleic acid-binding protein